MSDRYRWDEVPQGADWQGGEPMKSKDVLRSVVNRMLAKGGQPIVEIPAPHVVEEREKLAQLGARVLEILHAWNVERLRLLPNAGKNSLGHSGESMCNVLAAARSLGLLESEEVNRG